MASADLFEIAEYVKKINFYNAKSRYIQKTAQMIVNQFDGKVPNNVDDLIKLSGVGRKTAVAVLANGFGKYVGIAVDTHVIRFAKRFALSRHIDASKIEQDLLQIIPKKDWNSASYAIKEYGRREGRARNWKSEEDPVYQKFRR
jgi:endonuclease-3